MTITIIPLVIVQHNGEIGQRIPQLQPDDIRRQVLEMAALGRYSQGAIAEKLAITRSRVQKIIMKACTDL